MPPELLPGHPSRMTPALSDMGSTFARTEIIAEEICDKAAPIPDQTPSSDRNKLLNEVLALAAGEGRPRRPIVRTTDSA